MGLPGALAASPLIMIDGLLQGSSTTTTTGIWPVTTACARRRRCWGQGCIVRATLSARYGGEEFAVIAASADAAGRRRAGGAAAGGHRGSTPVHPGGVVTASLGVAWCWCRTAIGWLTG